MARVLFDIADPIARARYPAHGWALNSQGHRLLWLPVLRIARDIGFIRKTRGLDTKLTKGQWQEIQAFQSVARQLAVTLRELQRVSRVARDPGMDSADQARLNEIFQARELIPLYVDLSFVYLRRIADDFVRVFRCIAFINTESAPRELKTLMKCVSEPGRIDKYGATCDRIELVNVLSEYLDWFAQLRGTTAPNGEAQKGIRDILEHHPSAISVQNSKCGDDPWQVHAYLQYTDRCRLTNTDLFPLVQSVIGGLCAFWEQMVRLVVPEQNSFEQGDCLFLTGEDVDSTGLWPKLQQART